MAGETSDESGSFVVKNIQNVHLIKIDVVKFDDTNNIGLWRCKILDPIRIWRILFSFKRYRRK